MEPTIPTASFAFQDGFARLMAFVAMGGPAMWAIALLSVLTVALILWKIMRLISFGAFSGGRHTARALDLWATGQTAAAIAALTGRGSLRARLALAAMQAALNPALDQTAAEAETGRVARGLLVQARAGSRGLELAATIGPLLGLLGTVTGMIAAFQALQVAGSRADPAAL
ncbi:MAG: MotA/TolQ/ExbB proton channel family protein, partial [Paracoccaceae bacterium]